MTAVRLTSLVKGDLSGSSVLPEASSPATTVDTLEEGYEIAGPSDSYAMRMSAGASIVSDVSLDPYSTLHPAMSRGEQFRGHRIPHEEDARATDGQVRPAERADRHAA